MTRVNRHNKIVGTPYGSSRSGLKRYKKYLIAQYVPLLYPTVLGLYKGYAGELNPTYQTIALATELAEAVIQTIYSDEDEQEETTDESKEESTGK